MKRNLVIALVSLAAGCLMGVVGKDLVVPTANASSGGAVQNICSELKWDDVLGNKVLRPELGQKGFQVATVFSAEQKGGGTRIVACFTRHAGP